MSEQQFEEFCVYSTARGILASATLAAAGKPVLTKFSPEDVAEAKHVLARGLDFNPATINTPTVRSRVSATSRPAAAPATVRALTYQETVDRCNTMVLRRDLTADEQREFLRLCDRVKRGY